MKYIKSAVIYIIQRLFLLNVIIIVFFSIGFIVKLLNISNNIYNTSLAIIFFYIFVVFYNRLTAKSRSIIALISTFLVFSFLIFLIIINIS